MTGPHIKSGGYLLSQILADQVSSALEGLTSVFEMGTGVAPPATPPETLISDQMNIITSKSRSVATFFDNRREDEIRVKPHGLLVLVS